MRSSTAIFILAAAAGPLASGLESFSPRHFPFNPSTTTTTNNNNNNARSQPQTQTHAPHFTFEQLFQLQKKFLDNFISPANVIQAQSINSSLLAPNVQGRVDITRTFTGQELNTEYLFGLFANLATATDEFTLLGLPVSYEIKQFAASQNIAAAVTLFNFTFPFLANLTVPVTISTWNAFTPTGQISMYDATFTHWSWTFDYLLHAAASSLNMTLPQVQAFATQKLAGSICNVAQRYCNGTNAQYASVDKCLGFLTKEVRFGQAWELGRNTLLCRMVHQNMVPFRPSVHCPHIGPTGGGYCDDSPDYVGTVTQDYFSNYPFAYGGRMSGRR